MNTQNVINNETKSAQMTLTYHRVGDYYLPDLSAPDSPRIGKFGMMRHKYLRDHHRGIFDARKAIYVSIIIDSIVAIWARVALSLGLRVVCDVPLMRPTATAHLTARNA